MRLFLALGLSLASFGWLQPVTAAPSLKPALVTEVVASSTSNPTNALYSTVRLKGNARALISVCDSESKKIRFRKTMDEDRIIYRPEVTPSASKHVCLGKWIERSISFNETFKLRWDEIPRAYLRNVGSLGHEVSFDFLLETARPHIPPLPVIPEDKPKLESCEASLCPMIFKPATCTYKGNLKFSGGNRCEAIGKARASLCRQGLTLDLDDLDCVETDF